MYKANIYRKCPFCKDNSFEIELWNKYQDIYLLSCTNKNTSAGMWVTRNNRGRFYQVSVRKQQPRVIKAMTSYQKQEFEKLHIPLWKLLGLKPTAKELQYDRMLKARNMTYGDAVLERDRAAGAKESGGMEAFTKHMNNGGKVEDVSFGKTS